MLIVEELHLLLTDASGAPERLGAQRGYGAGAALLSDLLVRDLIRLGEERRPRVWTRPDVLPPDDEILRFGWDRVGEKEGARLERLLTWRKFDPWELVHASLTRAGVLSEGPPTFWGLGRPLTPEVDGEPERLLRERLGRLLRAEAEGTAADVSLLAILQELGMGVSVLREESGGMGARAFRQRVRELADGLPVAEALHRQVQAMQTALTVATMTRP